MIINENQKGFLFKNGKYMKLLDAGKYHLFGGKEIENVALEDLSFGTQQKRYTKSCAREHFCSGFVIIRQSEKCLGISR